MSDERERFREDRRSAADRERALARGGEERGEGRPVPVHRPGAIEFFPAVDPEEAWNRLNPEVRGVLARRAGQPLERWARVDDGLVTAILLGDRALVKATPNGRSHEFTELIPLSPETALLKEITETSGGGRTRTAGGGVERMPGSPVLDRMSQELRDFLGHLPEQAQRLMQKPFRDAAGPPRGEREIFQWETAVQRDWKVFGYLHDDRWATVVAGSGVLRGEAATWRLNCRRFRVRK